MRPSEPVPAATFESADDSRIPPGTRFFKIGEVSKIVDVPPHVLRYWESEFSWVRPEKTSSKQRRYRREDVALLLTIKRLRHQEQLTIARTRQIIHELRSKKNGRQSQRAMRGPANLVDTHVRSRADQTLLARRLMEMRQAVLDLMETVQD